MILSPRQGVSHLQDSQDNTATKDINSNGPIFFPYIHGVCDPTLYANIFKKGSRNSRIKIGLSYILPSVSVNVL